MPGAGREDRRVVEQVREPPRRGTASNAGDVGPRLLDRRRDGIDVGDARRGRRPDPAPRASSQTVTADGIALTPFGSTRTLPQVATAPCRSAAARASCTTRREREHRVVAGRPGALCRRGSPRRPGRGASGRAARWTRRRPPARSEVDQPAPLLDVQFDERRRCGAASRRRAPTCVRVVPGALHRLGERRRRRRRAARARAPAVIAPVSSREPVQAMPKRAPSSSAKLTTRDRPRGRDRRCARRASTRGEGRDHAERPVVRTAVGHRVEVRANDDARAVARPDRPTRPTGCRRGRRSRSSERAAASAANHSRSVASSAVQAKRR